MKNKCVLILGGSSDIGVELTKKYLSKNWQVICHYNKKNINEFDKLKKDYPNKLKTLKADFTSESSIKKVIKFVSKENIESMVNLVGYLDNISFKNTNLKSLLKSLQINSIAPLLIQKSILKKMINKKFGRILHASSIGVKYGGGEHTFNYSYSKHALEYIPRYVKNLTQFNILSNTLRIGAVNTKLHKKIKNKNIKRRIKLIPIKRFATRKEISEMIFFLGSEKNTYISGENVSISGGE
mgnify:CR=1 FL=1